MLSALIAGVSLGFSAGVSPGPLMTLVVTATLERGFGAGLRVAVAPLLTDLPIILLSVLIFSALPAGIELALTVGGGCLLIYLGIEGLRSAGDASLESLTEGVPQGRDLVRGMLVNLVSPHPWLFWLGVGAPILIGAWRVTPTNAFLFLFGFYLLLVGSKIGVAWAISGARHLLSEQWYRRILRLSALLLMLFGLLLFWQATIRVLG